MEIPSQMLQDTEFTKSTIELYAFLQERPEATSWSLRQVSEQLNQSFPTVGRNIKLLERKGYLTTKARTWEVV